MDQSVSHTNSVAAAPPLTHLVLYTIQCPSNGFTADKMFFSLHENFFKNRNSKFTHLYILILVFPQYLLEEQSSFYIPLQQLFTQFSK